MVRLTSHWSRSPERCSLLETIQLELALQKQSLHSKKIRVDVDLDNDLAQAPCAPAVRSAIEHILQLAIARNPRHSELQITACTTSRGLEIEIADAGDETDFPRLNAFVPQDCRQLVELPLGPQDFELYGSSCPQGGMAWTIVVKRRAAILKVA